MTWLRIKWRLPRVQVIVADLSTWKQAWSWESLCDAALKPCKIHAHTFLYKNCENARLTNWMHIYCCLLQLMISPMLCCSLLYNYNPLQITLSAVLDHVNFKIILYSTATLFVNFIFPVLSLLWTHILLCAWVLNQEMPSWVVWCSVVFSSRQCLSDINNL